MGCPRVSYRRRLHYATRSNQTRLVRTPGNRLILQRVAKRSQGVHTPWVLGHKRLAGTKALRHVDARNSPRHRKTVSRPYGGVLSHEQVRDRVVRAFLVEEQRIVKKVLAAEAKYQKEKRRRDTKRKRVSANRRAVEKKATGLMSIKKAVPVQGKKPAANVAAKAVVGSKLVSKGKK